MEELKCGTSFFFWSLYCKLISVTCCVVGLALGTAASVKICLARHFVFYYSNDLFVLRFLFCIAAMIPFWVAAWIKAAFGQVVLCSYILFREFISSFSFQFILIYSPESCYGYILFRHFALACAEFFLIFANDKISCTDCFLLSSLAFLLTSLPPI